MSEKKKACWMLADMHDRLLRGEDPDDFFPDELPNVQRFLQIEILSFGYLHLHDPDRRDRCLELLRQLQREEY